VHPDAVGAQLAAMATVVQVHDLHIWQITSGQPALSAHILVDPGADCHRARGAAERLLRGEHHIDHTTLQVDHATPDASADANAVAGGHCARAQGPVHHAPTLDPTEHD
jgi:cobalt-zinc-cadmium efflux system protein